MVAPLVAAGARTAAQGAARKTAAQQGARQGAVRTTQSNARPIGTRAGQPVRQREGVGTRNAMSPQPQDDPRHAQARAEQGLSQVQELFTARGEKFDDEDIDTLADGAPPKPPFPILIVAFAIIKDFTDIADFTLIGIIFTSIFSVAFSLTLMFWCFGKIHGGWWKKRMIRWLWMRYALVILIEFVPFIKVVPANMLFVLMVHYRETKIVKLLDAGLEALHGNGIEVVRERGQAVIRTAAEQRLGRRREGPAAA